MGGRRRVVEGEGIRKIGNGINRKVSKGGGKKLGGEKVEVGREKKVVLLGWMKIRDKGKGIE